VHRKSSVSLRAHGFYGAQLWHPFYLLNLPTSPYQTQKGSQQIVSLTLSSGSSNSIWVATQHPALLASPYRLTSLATQLPL